MGFKLDSALSIKRMKQEYMLAFLPEEIAKTGISFNLKNRLLFAQMLSEKAIDLLVQ